MSTEDWLNERSLQTWDSIFRAQTNWKMNACLNYSSDMSGTYVSGFRAMARMGIEAIKASGHEQDVLVYPIVFCYRHHIELQLKQSIAHGYEFVSRGQRPPSVHCVGRLWSELLSLLRDVKQETGEFPNVSDLKNAERVIQELAALDPDGISFRYAKTKDGHGSIDPELRVLNLLSFSEALEKLSFFLDCVESQLYNFVEYKREAEAEMRSAGFKNEA